MVSNQEAQPLPNRAAYVSTRFEKNIMTSTVSAYTHNADLVQSFAQFLETESYLDVTFICANNQTLKAHKLVLTSVSPFLKELLKNWDGPQNDIYISLPDISRKIMKLVLYFFYVGHMNLETEEMIEFKSALKLLKVQMSDAVVQRTSLLTRPPPLMALNKEHRQKLGRAQKGHSKVVETVSLNSASMFVPNEEASEEGNEPVIDIDVGPQNESSDKTRDECDPLNVPDFYFVQSVQPKPVENTPSTVVPPTPSHPATSNQATASDPNSSLLPLSVPVSSLNSPSVPSLPVATVPQSLPGTGISKPNKRSNAASRQTKLPNKTKTTPSKARKTQADTESTSKKSTGHSTRQQSSKVSHLRGAEVPGNAQNTEQDEDPIGWLFKLKKEELIEQLQQFNLDTIGSVSALRLRLSHYLQHELRDERDSPPPPLAAPSPSPKREPNTSDTTKRPAPDVPNKSSPLKRKPNLHDIASKLKQPRVVIRDMADDIALHERMKLCGGVLVRTPTKSNPTVQQPAFPSDSEPMQLLSMMPVWNKVVESQNDSESQLADSSKLFNNSPT